MKRVVATVRGGPEVLELVDEETPAPRTGEARVRMVAAGASFTDVLMREGTYLGGPRHPFTPGYDLVGVVDAVGPGTARVRPGEVVVALTVYGAYAEYVCLPESDLVPVPAGVDPADALSLVFSYLTAWQVLHRVAKVSAGERMLVHGASGAVGLAALELGEVAGLELIGTASAAKAPMLVERGCEPIDYSSESFLPRVRALPGRGVDVVLDGIGGSVTLRSYRALRRHGRLVLYGHQLTLRQGRRSRRGVLSWYGTLGAVAALALVPDGRRIRAYRIAKMKERHPDWFREDMAALFALLGEGRLQPLVADRIPLADVRRAHQLVGAGQVRGKLLLVP
jgi:NADPH:quinone reductase